MEIEKYIAFLGSDQNGMRYFMNTRGEKQGDYLILCKSARSLGNKYELQELAPYAVWMKDFKRVDKEGTQTGIDWDAASQWMISRSSAGTSGLYSEDRIRGRGVWLGDKEYVLHLGDRALVSGDFRSLDRIQGDYFYPRLKQIEIPEVREASEIETDRIIEISQLFDWKDKELAPRLFAGWCALAPICGGLSWRPHLWINAPAQSGKSTLANIAIALTGNFNLPILSSADTTVAGLRQSIGSDAVPVIFDEAEGEETRSRDKTQELLGLIRSASTESDAAIRKGTPGQKALIFRLRNMFMLTSINNSLKHEQDIQRFIQLELKPPVAGTGSSFQGKVVRYDRVKELLSEFNKTFAAKLLLRSARLLPVIRHNIEVLIPIVGAILQDMRKATNYSTLLAGDLSLRHDRKLTVEEAKMFINGFQWEDKVENEEEDAAHHLFNLLMGAMIDVDTHHGHSRRTVVEAIHNTRELGIKDCPPNKALERYGMSFDLERDQLFVASSHPFLEKVFHGTIGAVGWNRVMKNLEGTVSSQAKRINGMVIKGSYYKVNKEYDDIPIANVREEAKLRQLELDELSPEEAPF